MKFVDLRQSCHFRFDLNFINALFEEYNITAQKYFFYIESLHPKLIRFYALLLSGFSPYIHQVFFSLRWGETESTWYVGH
jgi:hypothetical protein